MKPQAILLSFLNFISLPFRWLNPLFREGYKRKLGVNDMYNVVPEDSSEFLCERLQKYVLMALFLQDTTGKYQKRSHSQMKSF